MIFLIFRICAHGESTMGVFLSLGQMHSNVTSFDSSESPSVLTRQQDYILGITFTLNNSLEFSAIYNRHSGDVELGDEIITFDKDGIGLEISKVFSTHVLEKNDFMVYLEFTTGFYAMTYPFKYFETDVDKSYNKAPATDSFMYQLGFSWSVRTRVLVSKKAAFNLGFKSILPIRTNEFSHVTGQQYIMFKSFVFVGMVF